MYTRNRLLGERPKNGIIAGVLLSASIIVGGWTASFAYNAKSDMRTIVRQVGAVMVATTKPATHVEWPVANREGKADKSYASALSDDEAAGDLADAEEAMAKRVIAQGK